MRLDEEAKRLEKQLLGTAPRIKDVATLKTVLHSCLTTFENEVDKLPIDKREEALSLYLDEIRRVTFGYHAAILLQGIRQKFHCNPLRQNIRPFAEQHSRQLGEIAKLYQFL